jgi:hypothetical protein
METSQAAKGMATLPDPIGVVWVCARVYVFLRRRICAVIRACVYACAFLYVCARVCPICIVLCLLTAGPLVCAFSRWRAGDGVVCAERDAMNRPLIVDGCCRGTPRAKQMEMDL